MQATTETITKATTNGVTTTAIALALGDRRASRPKISKRLCGAAALAVIAAFAGCGVPPDDGAPIDDAEQAATIPTCGDTLNTTFAALVTDVTLTPPPVIGFQLATGNRGATCSAVLTATTRINGQIQQQGQFRQTFTGHTTTLYKIVIGAARDIDLDVTLPFQNRRFFFRNGRLAAAQ
jgi:hypothetical protein